MQIGRVLLAAVVAGALSVATVDTAYADPVEPTPAPGATPAPAPAEATAPGDVVILHTDSSAVAGSGALTDALDELGASVRHRFAGQQAVSVALPPGTDPATATARLDSLPGVRTVEPAVSRSFSATPNDPALPRQRGYLNAIAAPAAWATQSGSKAVTIAVVDSGVDVGHPDLRGKIAGTYNAVTRRSSIPDTVGHGTFVAGVAAAGTNNNVGVAGVGYNTRILAVKVADEYGDIALDDEVAGIRWAADHHATVINLSLGGSEASAAEQNAVRYAQHKGSLVVAAAGNEGNAARQYPAAYPGVIAVGATDVANGTRAGFSSYGSWVTLAAPGVNVYSTTPRAGSDYFPGRSGYAYGDGTSFATPMVSGAAALLKAQNPTAMTATALRNALLTGAHGYAGKGLGRGQVDVAASLAHVVPTSVPTGVGTVGTVGTVVLRASSNARRVGFLVDGVRLPTVPVIAGVASASFDSAGWANAGHRVTAVACTAFGECSTRPSAAAVVTFANPSPALTVPASVSGPFHADGTTASGGGLRLLVDGKEAGFDARAPYTFDVNGSTVANGVHRLTVQTCTVSRSRCDGPTSGEHAVTFDSLHPAIAALSRTAVSPNGDRSGDTAAVTLRLNAPASAKIETRNAAGVPVRTYPLVSTATSYVWRGLDDAGTRLPDGRYTLAVVTADAGGRHGLAERAVVVDTVAPHLRGVTGNGTRFYPARDGYRDTFAPTASLPDGGVLTLTITTAAGRATRTVQANRAPVARTSLPWNGRTTAGRQAPAGTYRWTFTASDAAGNATRSPSYVVTVSSQQLRTRTVSLTRNARVKSARGTASCAGKKASKYRRGVHLVNRCTSGSEDVAYADYSVQLPSAYRYQRISLVAFGRAARRSEVSGSFVRTDGGLEVPRSRKIPTGKARWRTISTVPASGHVSGTHRVRFALVLGSRYAGVNDFDVRSVRLRVTLTRLQ